jgi:hypothetical protein
VAPLDGYFPALVSNLGNSIGRKQIDRQFSFRPNVRRADGFRPKGAERSSNGGATGSKSGKGGAFAKAPRLSA